MTTIFIENKSYEVEEGQNLLQASLTLGFNLPYFCWHPALGSVGACRQCAVKQYKNESDTRGRIVMACMTPAAEGARISIEDAEARDFREHVIEWMMISHPHDCPVCDEGGECHLQDMTVMTGHTYRRFCGKKRTFHNQDLGPFVNHEMNRCIQCYRCVRYYRDFAGGRDFDAFGIHDQVYFGRAQDGALESEFSGNLVEICPTGVFTDKTLKEHYTRKWDLQTAPSICNQCSLGCNTIPGERYGSLRRIRNRYNQEVNGYFLCDRGRYGYEFVNSEQRIRHPHISAGGEEPGLERAQPGGGELRPASKEEALQNLSKILSGSSTVIGIGSPRASLEANFALRDLVGPGNFYAGIPEKELELTSRILASLRRGPARTASMRDVASADAVFVLGEDVSNTAPMLALALRQSIQQKSIRAAEKQHIPEWDAAARLEVAQGEKGPLFTATLASTRLDDAATETYHAAPDDLARLGWAVARELGAQVHLTGEMPEETLALARRIAKALREAERPVILSGASLGSDAVVQAAVQVAWALCSIGRPAKVAFSLPECNSMGLGLLGGGSLEAAFEAVQRGEAETVIILENDLYRRAPRPAVDRFLEKAPHVIVLDHLANGATARAEILLPAATFAEGDGTLVNNEGRAQRFYQVFAPEGEILESWRWLGEISSAAGRQDGKKWQNLDEVTTAAAQALSILEPIQEVAPPASFRLAGQKIPRQPARYSGRTAMHANVDVNEPKPPEDPDSPLAFSMEGYDGQPPSPLIPRFWAPGWNSIQSLNKFQDEVGGPLRGGDPGRRLIEPSGEVAGEQPINTTHETPPAFQPRQGEWLIGPLYHVFGSEELSLFTPGIAELAPKPYLGVSPEDAGTLQVQDGQEIVLELEESLDRDHPKISLRLPAKILPGLPRGVAGLPVGLPGLPWVGLPGWGKLASLKANGIYS